MKTVVLSSCCQRPTQLGHRVNGAPFDRCSECFRPCDPIRYVPESALHDLVCGLETEAASMRPHVINVPGIRRFANRLFPQFFPSHEAVHPDE